MLTGCLGRGHDPVCTLSFCILFLKDNLVNYEFLCRSCDSTFGLDMDNSNEMGWFSSSHAIEGSDDAKLSFDFSGCGTSGLESATEQEIYGLDNVLATDESEKKGNSQNLTANDNSMVIKSSYVNGSRTSSIDGNSQVRLHIGPFSNCHTKYIENIIFF